MKTDSATTRKTPQPVGNELFGGRLVGAYYLTLTVTSISDPSPHVRVVRFSSEDLNGFSWRGGQDVMISFPSQESVMRRRYSIRRCDAVGATMDIEFERHGGVGVAKAWLDAVTVGDRLEAIGPRGAIFVGDDARTLLFVVDDSAAPAAFAMVENMPTDAVARVVVVTPHRKASRPAPATSERVALYWVDEGDLVAHLEALSLSQDVHAYVFGERQLVASVSSQLQSRGLAKDAISTKAYWRRDKANEGHGEPAKE